jgi:hypothetical protein
MSTLTMSAALRISAAMLRDVDVCGPENSHSQLMEAAAKRIEQLESEREISTRGLCAQEIAQVDQATHRSDQPR